MEKSEKPWKWMVPVGCVVLLACGVCVAGIAIISVYQEEIVAALAPTLGDIISTPTPISQSQDQRDSLTYTLGDMQALIREKNGQPCEENPDFTCITLSMPLDQFDASNGKTVDVVFAVHQATGERQGMFFQAYPGGPGGEGISLAFIDRVDDRILESYDLVFFDQRGIGLSSPLACPSALAAYYGDPSEDDTEGEEGYDTPGEQEEITATTRTFVDDCVKEMGVSPEELQFYNTQQVAEDIDDFRAAVGDEKFYLYGVSYGTVVAQIYAAAYPESLAGLILDGTVDLTLTGDEGSFAQEKAFEKVLLATFEACNDDELCTEAFDGEDPLKVYDDLAASLAQTPQAYSFPLPDGTTSEHQMTFTKLESTAAYQMYSTGSRMLFLRALAAARQGDLIPLARLYYAQFKYDPASEVYLGDPSFSDIGYYFVHCADDSYFSGTPEERLARIFEEGQASNGTIPRLDGNIYTGLVCALWPSSSDSEVRAEPFVAEGIPTFVLNATLDPATPFEEGKAVYERLADGYHLYVEGGPHSIYGYEEECPDEYIADFLISGKLPSQRETQCSWDEPVMWSYISPMPADAGQLGDLLLTFYQVDLETILLPEHFYNSEKSKDIAATCPYGGNLSFILEDKDETFTFNQCEFSEGLVLTGTANINVVTWNRDYTFDITGLKSGSLHYVYDAENGSITLQGTYDGEEIDLAW
ncbi:MAG: alpha/beta hydrolase [Anaerolineae bacterium]|nr:alpha/beta hydrolase [Anaerolineae bacterium]